MLTQNEIVSWYKNNPTCLNELLGWFELDGPGIRCKSLRPYDRSYKYVWKDYYLDRYYGYPMDSLNVNNIVNCISYARTIQFLDWIFDERIRECECKNNVPHYFIGLTPVFDIDMLAINPKKKSEGRYDILSNKAYVNFFNDYIGELEDSLKEVDLWRDIQSVFSGNGVQLFPVDFYFDTIQEVQEMLSGMFGLIADVEHKFGRDNRQDSIINHKVPGWNANHKPPYTFHYIIDNRLSLPLNPRKELDYDWLIENSNPCNEEVYVQ